MSEDLKSGDKVVELAAAATTAGVIAGLAAGGLGAWLAWHRVVPIVIGLLAGAALGFVVGKLIGKVLFPAPDGNVTVAKWGPSSLPLTLKGNIISGAITVLAASALLTFFSQMDFPAMAIPCVGIAIAISAVLALLASLA